MPKKEVVFGEVPDMDEGVLYEGPPVRLAISKVFLEMMLEACGEAHSVEAWIEKIDVSPGPRGIPCLGFRFAREPEARVP